LNLGVTFLNLMSTIHVRLKIATSVVTWRKKIKRRELNTRRRSVHD